MLSSFLISVKMSLWRHLKPNWSYLLSWRLSTYLCDWSLIGVIFIPDIFFKISSCHLWQSCIPSVYKHNLPVTHNLILYKDSHKSESTHYKSNYTCGVLQHYNKHCITSFLSYRWTEYYVTLPCLISWYLAHCCRVTSAWLALRNDCWWINE